MSRAKTEVPSAAVSATMKAIAYGFSYDEALAAIDHGAIERDFQIARAANLSLSVVRGERVKLERRLLGSHASEGRCGLCGRVEQLVPDPYGGANVCAVCLEP